MATDDMTFYVSLPDVPVYLRPRGGDKTANGVDKRPGAGLKTARYASLYIFDPSPGKGAGDAPENSDTFYVQSCLATQSLYRRLVEQEDLSPQFEFVLGAAYSKSSTGRQLYALRLKADGEEQADHVADDALLSLAQKQEFGVGLYEKDAQNGKHSILWRLADTVQSKDSTRPMPNVLMETGMDYPEVSPIFQENRFSPVFHDFERSMKILNMVREMPEVRQVLDVTAQQLAECCPLSQLQDMMTHPLIVVEGMDATGKTTLTQFLEQKLGAARYSTPPPCLLAQRKFFDRLPEIVRRAYYSLGNYIVAQQIAKQCQKTPVIMDRFWHSTAAYGIANETSDLDLPPRGHLDYCWPDDLLKPSLVIFLTVSEAERRQRLGHRHDNAITFEEKSLNRDQLFRKRLCEAYLRMTKPACVEVDASGTKDQVVEAVMALLKQRGIAVKEC